MTVLPRRAVAAVLATGLLLSWPAAATAAPPPELDAIIHGGKVFDGSGAPGRVTDVGLKDGRVHRIGDLGRIRARTRYDATGQYVTPGFIDIHAHTETGPPLAGAKSSLTQGVTTELLGPDGGGAYEIEQQLRELDAAPKGINVAPYVGFNTVWQATMGERDTRPTAAQSAQMRARIESGMRQGGWGVSGGLGYPPASYARTQEVAEVVRGARAWRAMFTDHIRDETNQVVESTAEDIAIGKAAGLMPEITHMKVAGPGNWGKSATMLRLLREARAAGTHAGGDVYPYTAASTALEFYVPGWAKDGGTAAMLARFADPALRPRIDAETSAFVRDDVGTPDKVVLPDLANKTIADLMAEYGGVSIGEAIMRVLKAHNGSILAVMHIGSEEDLANFITDPFVAFSSDGGVTESAQTHPRHYGSYPRVLGRYVRERGLLSWEEAIRKMTGLPATMVGMVDRGYLAEGMAADVTVFDPKTIGDRATFEHPKQYSVGVRWVFVNGKLALTGGEPTRAAAGQALRRASSMPTRPQHVGKDRTVATAGLVRPETGGANAIVVALAQHAGARSAAGTVVVAGPHGVLHSVRLGRLQTADGWFSVTGIGRLGTGPERAFTLTVDRHDPLAAPNQRRATVRIDGSPTIYGPLS
ncbi:MULTISPECIES: amidohydrolase family protein [unclassified Crossiella]|uniref:N-acyl-D-amino-acid deacylase family protein n=1 Tax=unclassified Crossiella TaxID=2620835 RepID=UPI001FFF1E3F|nr:MULTISPECIES: amidohydrolase family protein [unclassified Crossiella]MCK2244475.1 amidohydrolase family protein [Crossiella sp. S99.2]MCK2258106.1 amidohydrolase family protein [Crossiella sp. S99.1]